MTTLKKLEDVVEDVIDCYTPYEGGTLDWSAAMGVVKADRTTIAAVLKERLEGLPSMDVDEYVAIIKSGNWDKMYEAGVKAAQNKAIAIIDEVLTSEANK